MQKWHESYDAAYEESKARYPLHEKALSHSPPAKLKQSYPANEFVLKLRVQGFEVEGGRA